MNPTDDLLTEMRELARRLVANNDDTADDAAEQGCRLAALVLDHLATARAKTAPRPSLPVDAVAAVVDYLDETERHDYDATPAAERHGHIYGHVRRLRQWLRSCG